MTGFTPFDLQAPAQLLTPAFSPAASYQRPWSTLPEPAEGHVWVDLTDDYYEGMQWSVVQPGRTQMELRDVRQITVEQLAAWDGAKAAFEAAQREALALYREAA